MTENGDKDVGNERITYFLINIKQKTNVHSMLEKYLYKLKA